MKVHALHYKKDHRIMVRYEKDGVMFTDEVYLEHSDDEWADTVLWGKLAQETIDEVDKIKRALDIVGSKNNG